MSTTLLYSLVDVESDTAPKTQFPISPRPAVPRSSRSMPRSDNDHVETINLRRLASTPQDGTTTTRPEGSGNLNAEGSPGRDVEDSAGNPVDGSSGFFDALPSLSDSPMNKYRLMTCCLINFTGGLTDAAPGALIPYMEEYYSIGYAVVSLIFVGMALGFIVAAPLIDTLRTTLHRSKAIALSQVLLILGYLPLVCTAPFPAVIVGYFFIGFGTAVPLALNNVFCANMRNGTTMLGLMHGSYGMGGTIAPLMATALVTQAHALFGRYYIITVGFAAINAVFGAWAFWNYEKEQADAEAKRVGPVPQQQQQLVNGPRVSTREHVKGMFHAFRLRVALLGALFLFAYQGAEVSISGWVISFLIAVRNGDPASIGYVTAGFWAGITIGRFVLSPVGAKIGEKLFVYLLIAGAAVFQLLVWLVPNIIAESVSLAIVGLLLGPVYPCSATVFARNLSTKHQVAGLSLISAFGTSGGAVAPFTTGLLAQAAGTFVLHPIAIGLFAVVAIAWFGQPSIRKRTE